ncbi:bifunctional alpha,alpha-trehalose-phosphate synthase (UDP-forming)/trehalose-phosphatase [Mucilaginibacter litoreus]|uniref:Bifunctional alpha,alpha-trehalose-phosphate synthase (UDP-forming)/trehalose-phosphatase n=1 Tax=Mucilaginibacter litoreus TaxID=1048221 RepID=A0ABW3AVJ3_9SPHI
MQKRLYILSNRLPLTIEKEGAAYTYRQSSGGLISAVGAYLNKEGKEDFAEKYWVGVPGCTEKVWNSVPDKENGDYKYVPVFVNNKTYDYYYNGFSNSLIWPLFHYFPSYADYRQSYFDAYLEVNRTFAEQMASVLKEDDIVWIHDYHLLPLAGLLRNKFPNLTIGFFLHIPFPSFELFRVIPKRWQREILSGMLGADLIGFHTADYSRHFLNCVEKIFDIQHDGDFILRDNRKIKVSALPIGIDYEMFNNAYNDIEVIKKRAEYLRLKQDKKLIFSVDRLDYTKGIYNRLKGYDQFLKQNPEYVGKVVFALVVVPSRDTIGKYAEKKKDIDEYIGDLNSRYGDIGSQPILYQYGHLSFDELVGLYTACDLALITPLRDGMNLVSKEFIATRKDKHGVLVLSEMAGAAHELNNALLINPNDYYEIADKIKYGLEMKPEEQERRIMAMQKQVEENDVNSWAKQFFYQMKEVKDIQGRLHPKMMDNFSRVHMLNKYAAAKNRLLLLDYDGTLVPFKKEPGMAKPGDELLETLAQLASHPYNTVYIVSGRDNYTLEEWLGKLAIGIIAEHGAKQRNKGESWVEMVDSEFKGQLKSVEEVMEKYVESCPGSFIEKKDFSLAWHYRKADPFTGINKSKELYKELLERTTGLPLNILNGHKVIEVKSLATDKGKAIEKILNSRNYDFILSIGDDQTDEDMFRKLANRPEAFTIKVGEQISHAKYNVLTPYLVQSLLQTIANYPEQTVLNE